MTRRLTRIGRLLLLAVVDDLILVGHLNVLILLHVITVMRKECGWFNECAVMAAKKQRERSKRERERKRERAGTWLQSTRPWSGNDHQRRGEDGWTDGWMDRGITESSKERGWYGWWRERAYWSTLQYKGPPQGGAFSSLLDYSLAVVPSTTRAEIEKSTAPFTTSHHFQEPSLLFYLF